MTVEKDESTWEGRQLLLYMLPCRSVARVSCCVFRHVSGTCDRRRGGRLLLFFRCLETTRHILATSWKKVMMSKMIPVAKFDTPWKNPRRYPADERYSGCNIIAAI